MERDETGRFVAQVKAKGAEAMESIAKARPSKGKETVEEESAEHGVKLDAPLESHKGEETPEEEAAEEKEIAQKYGPAKKPSYKPWNMESKKGW